MTKDSALTLAYHMLLAIESGKTYDAAAWHARLTLIEQALDIDSARARHMTNLPSGTPSPRAIAPLWDCEFYSAREAMRAKGLDPMASHVSDWLTSVDNARREFGVQ